MAVTAASGSHLPLGVASECAARSEPVAHGLYPLDVLRESRDPDLDSRGPAAGCHGHLVSAFGGPRWPEW